MKILFKTGSLLDATEPVIAHGCNDRGVMGRGVAKTIREKFPAAYRAYMDVYRANGNTLQLGRIVWVPVAVGRTIANCITQRDYGTDGKRYASYDAITQCIEGINMEARERRHQHGQPNDQKPFDAFALPMIGAGLGGADWGVVERIVERYTPDVQPVVYVLDSEKR